MLSHLGKKTFATQLLPTRNLSLCLVISRAGRRGLRGLLPQVLGVLVATMRCNSPTHPIVKPEQRSLLCRPHLSSPERSQQPGTSDCTACVGCLRGETTEWHSRYALTLFAHTLSPLRVSFAVTYTPTQRTDTHIARTHSALTQVSG